MRRRKRKWEYALEISSGNGRYLIERLTPNPDGTEAIWKRIARLNGHDGVEDLLQRISEGLEKTDEEK